MNKLDPVMAELRRAKDTNARTHKSLAQYVAYLQATQSKRLSTGAQAKSRKALQTAP